MPRGGRRSGRDGKAYGNRTDLNVVRSQTVPGQQYGQAAAQMRSMSAVPMGTPTAPSPAGGMGAAPAAPPPPSLAFDRPTEYPDRPITNGLSTGPGAGPEILGLQENAPDPDLIEMVKHLPALEMMAMLPSSTPTFRNFVRRVRGAAPPPV